MISIKIPLRFCWTLSLNEYVVTGCRLKDNQNSDLIKEINKKAKLEKEQLAQLISKLQVPTLLNVIRKEIVA